MYLVALTFDLILQILNSTLEHRVLLSLSFELLNLVLKRFHAFYW